MIYSKGGTLEASRRGRASSAPRPHLQHWHYQDHEVLIFLVAQLFWNNTHTHTQLSTNAH